MQRPKKFEALRGREQELNGDCSCAAELTVDSPSSACRAMIVAFPPVAHSVFLLGRQRAEVAINKPRTLRGHPGLKIEAGLGDREAKFPPVFSRFGRPASFGLDGSGRRAG